MRAYYSCCPRSNIYDTLSPVLPYHIELTNRTYLWTGHLCLQNTNCLERLLTSRTYNKNDINYLSFPETSGFGTLDMLCLRNIFAHCPWGVRKQIQKLAFLFRTSCDCHGCRSLPHIFCTWTGPGGWWRPLNLGPLSMKRCSYRPWAYVIKSYLDLVPQ